MKSSQRRRTQIRHNLEIIARHTAPSRSHGLLPFCDMPFRVPDLKRYSGFRRSFVAKMAVHARNAELSCDIAISPKDHAIMNKKYAAIPCFKNAVSCSTSSLDRWTENRSSLELHSHFGEENDAILLVRLAKRKRHDILLRLVTHACCTTISC